MDKCSNAGKKIHTSSKCKINLKLTEQEILLSHIKIIYQVEKAMHTDEGKKY